MSAGRRLAIVIEPDRSLSYVMAAILKRNDFEVVTCAKVEAALKAMKGESVKLIIVASEIKTDRYDGIDVCRAMNKSFKGRVPVVVSSRTPTEESVIRSIKSGALEYLVKPSSEQMILQKVNSALSRGNDQFIVADNVKDLNFEEGMTLSEMIDVVIEEADEIRALPQAVAKITQVSQDEKSGAAAMEQAISSDPSIVGMVLKRANSAFYKGQNDISDVKKAVVRIGFNECRKMVLGFSLFNLFSKEDRSFGFNRMQFWLHSVTVAIIAEGLCKKAGVDKADDAFLAGLLHDFGKLLLDDYLSVHFQRALQLANLNNLTVYESETNIFERTHSAVSKGIMDKWNFPEHISAAALRHHVVPKPDPQAGYQPDINSALFFANQLAKVSLLGSGGDCIATPIPEGLWSAFKFEGETFEDSWLDDIFAKIAQFLEFLGINQEDVGRAVERPPGRPPAVVIKEMGSDVRMVSWFLQCLGHEVVVLRDGDEIPDIVFGPTFIIGEERESLDSMAKSLFTAIPDTKIQAITGKFRYVNNNIPEEHLKVHDGRVDFRMMRMALK